MSPFRADLHIHSRFSRATSSRLNVPHLAAWAGLKGLSVLGTGDFTHPAWRDELKQALVFDENSGLYRLAKPLNSEELARQIPGLEDLSLVEPKFMLQAEISSIYKKNGAVRKVHSLVYTPDFASADSLSRKLEQIGNLNSDGRPILGMDAKHLLEMVLEIPGAFFIPAHIWTPWFSVFGSKSGFDSLEECFGDLAPYIFALETGLSSDPDMNRCWSGLDRFTLVSNSDAHSGENLGREATVFSGMPSYYGMLAALKKEAPDYAGTLEFFPEEGKYHLDGHRDCGVFLSPEECRHLNNICPVCGRTVTVGVLHRVLDLADRTMPPAPGAQFLSIVPLAEIVGEILQCGSKTKKVQAKLHDINRRFGPELDILLDLSVGDLGRYWPELGEAVKRMRAGQVIRTAGYDGQYGYIRLFQKQELAAGLSRGALLTKPDARPGLVFEKQAAPVPLKNKSVAPLTRQVKNKAEPLPEFTPSQAEALAAGPGPVLVVAGPGSGKTRTLIGRMIKLLKSGVDPKHLVAITFTRRAAEELQERLAAGLPEHGLGNLPLTDTLHAIALKYWPGQPPVVMGEESARRAFMQANPEVKGKTVWHDFSVGRESLRLDQAQQEMFLYYSAWKEAKNLADYTDLLEKFLLMLHGPEAPSWAHVLVDEIQDLSPLQLAIITAMTPQNGHGFFGIGDPDQSIYSFRGAVTAIQARLKSIWPELVTKNLAESHRAPAKILAAGRAVLGAAAACQELRANEARPAVLECLAAPDAEKEAAWIADKVAWLIGGTSHLDADQERNSLGHLTYGSCSPGEIAVLVRIKALLPVLAAALEKRGIPFTVPQAEAFWKDPLVERILLGASKIAREEPADDPILALIPGEVWADGPKTILHWAERNGHADFFWMHTGNKAVNQLAAAFEQSGSSWRLLLDSIALRQELDLVSARAQKVQLMTLHASKGLEFKVIFLPCLEKGLLPFYGMGELFEAENNRQDEEEERRLFYVGLTRASDAVFISHAQIRTIYGKVLHQSDSPFIPTGHCKNTTLHKHKKILASQLSFLSR